MGFSYDGLNRLTLVDNPQGGSAANDVDRSFVYDLLGRMTRAQDQNGHFAEMGFDALGRQTSEASLNGGTKTMQYDAAGRRTRLTWPDQFFVSYDYNDAGDMTHIRESGAASGAGVLATFGYDDLGRRTSLARGNGSETTYGYDAAGRLSHVGHHIPTPTGLFEPFTYYSYNAAGQIVSVNRPDSLAYAGVTNQNVTDTHNGLNQVTQTGGAATAHDARGNTTADGSGTTFLYNLANELVARNGATQLYYEPLGRLTQQWNGGGTLDWVGSQLIADYSGGFGNRRHVHGPGVDEPLVTYENGQRRHLHADERGSVVMLTDDASAVTATNRYDEYGQPQGGSVAGRFGFTGQAWLPEIGLHYYKARMYDQSRGRFMQNDRLGYGDGMNRYTYVGGDPVNFTDPTGQYCWDNGDGTSDCIITGRRLSASGGANVFYRGGSLGSGGDNGGGGGSSSGDEDFRCTLGNGAVDMTVDGGRITIVARYRLDGTGTGGQEYAQGMARSWSSPGTGGYSLDTRLVENPTGFILRVFPGYRTDYVGTDGDLGTAYTDVVGNTTRVNMGSLSEVSGAQRTIRIT